MVTILAEESSFVPNKRSFVQNNGLFVCFDKHKSFLKTQFYSRLKFGLKFLSKISKIEFERDESYKPREEF